MSRTQNPASLNALAKAKWKKSGLTDAQAKRLKLTGLSGVETARRVGGRAASSLLIPYFDADGAVTEFIRVRYLEAVVGSKGKLQRYKQKKGTINEIYLAPLLKQPWSEVLADPSTSLIITEGELKAAKGCAEGLPVLGLGGVECWRSNRHGLPLLPQLEQVEWKGRRVYIVFDSDYATNPDVMRAQQQLAHFLMHTKEAKPRIVKLPAHGREKQGLDDFLVRAGKKALLAVLEEAADPSDPIELWDMNEKVIFVHDPPMVVSRETGQRLSVQSFTGANFVNRKHDDLTNKQRPKIVKTAQAWLEWPQRLEVRRLTYEPGQPELCAPDFFNMWRGLAVEPMPGSIEPWSALLDFLFQDESGKVLEAERRWFEMWCSYPLQHVGTKLFTAVAFFGHEHGTGKSLVGELLAAIYGKDNSSVIGNSELTSQFNDWAENKQLVVGEEITGTEQRSNADRLKALITQKTMRINAKYIQPFVIPDYVNYFFTSNQPDSFFLDDQDRRFFVHEIIGRPKPIEFYERITRWRDGDGLSHLLNHFLTLDLNGFQPHAAALRTRAKEAMIRDGKTDAALWVASLRESPTEALLKAFGEQIARGCDLFTTGDLLGACPVTATSQQSESYFGKVLKRSRFRQVNGGLTIRARRGSVRLYAVRNVDQWLRATPKACGDHYDKFHAPFEEPTREGKF